MCELLPKHVSDSELESLLPFAFAVSFALLLNRTLGHSTSWHAIFVNFRTLHSDNFIAIFSQPRSSA